MRALMGFKRSLILTAAIIAVLGGTFAEACNVPVFRYALEHWRPDAYRAVLLHRGPLSAADQERLDALTRGAQAGQVNLAIRTVDLDALPRPEDKDLLAAAATVNATAKLPQLLVQFPPHLQLEQPIWSGSLDDQATLLDSPVRRELLQRLTKGQTAVWVMVDSGDAAQDDAAVKLLEQELQNLQKTLKLPELTEAPEDMIQDGPPLRIEFSLLRVRRDDPAEQSLIAMLIACESDLATLNAPLVFPVFGRSRALFPLVGLGISADNIRGSAMFLVGACSCQVKQLNPGFDLLVTADWNELLSWATSPAFASGDPTGEAVLVPIPKGSAPSQTPVSTPGEAPTAAPAAASVAAAVAAPGPAAAAPVAPPQAAPKAGPLKLVVMITVGVLLAVAALVVVRQGRM